MSTRIQNPSALARGVVKERPILFNAMMVRAILDGSKTQTRRVMKRQPFGSMTEDQARSRLMELGALGPDESLAALVNGARNAGFVNDPCPFGIVGDLLWVRESFWGCDLPCYGDLPCVVYDDEWLGKEYKPAQPRPCARKFGCIPSIHMPRDCSRITLEITDVRVERLTGISEADAKAEGAPSYDEWSYAESFQRLWESINGHYSWDENPWVWVISFRRILP